MTSLKEKLVTNAQADRTAFEQQVLKIDDVYFNAVNIKE